jgi:hypothetical protein
VLQLSPEEAVLLLQRAPLLMNNRPEAVQERYRGIQQVLQVGGQGCDEVAQPRCKDMVLLVTRYWWSLHHRMVDDS